MTYLWIVVLGGILSAQFLLARIVPEPLTSVLRIQAVYWFLGYVLRPLILAVAAPAPVVNDSVADHRLAYGGYASNLPDVLLPIVVGQAIFLTTALLLGTRLSSRFRPVEPSPALMLVLSVILLGARLGWVAGSRSPIILTLLEMAPVVIGMILVAAHPRRRLMLLMSVLLITEAAWSVVFASKTPIFSLLICLLVTAAARGWRPKLKHIALVGVAIPTLVLGFSVIQSVKQTAAVKADLQTVDARYPTVVRPVMPIVRRFDLLEAVTDSMYVSGRWMSLSEFAGSLGGAFVPRPVNPAKAESAGERWAIEVRNTSKPTRPGVSLAEGPVAEGHALAGLPGVVAECAILALLTVAGTRALAVGRTFVFSLGCSLIFLPTLLERGLLGVAEVLGKGLQVTLVVGLLSLVFGGLRRVGTSDGPSGRVSDGGKRRTPRSGRAHALDRRADKLRPVERYVPNEVPPEQLSTYRMTA